MGKSFTQADVEQAKKNKAKAASYHLEQIRDAKKEITELVLQNVDKYALNHYCDQINDAIHKIKGGEYVESINLFRLASTEKYVERFACITLNLSYIRNNEDYLNNLEFLRSRLSYDGYIPVWTTHYKHYPMLPEVSYAKIGTMIEELYPDVIIKKYNSDDKPLYICYFDKKAVPNTSCCTIL